MAKCLPVFFPRSKTHALQPGDRGRYGMQRACMCQTPCCMRLSCGAQCRRMISWSKRRRHFDFRAEDTAPSARTLRSHTLPSIALSGVGCCTTLCLNAEVMCKKTAQVFKGLHSCLRRKRGKPHPTSPQCWSIPSRSIPQAFIPSPVQSPEHVASETPTHPLVHPTLSRRHAKNVQVIIALLLPLHPFVAPDQASEVRSIQMRVLISPGISLAP